jgi:CubicO group peptidase (beta-lactamase class C family)
MKKLRILLLSVLIFSQYFNSLSQNTPGIDYPKLDAYIETSMKEWGIPGMAIAVVEGNRITFAKGYGVKEYGKDGKVDIKTLFSIASNTKSFTTAALSQLVNEGKISWDDKVVDYLPWFRMYDNYVTAEMTIRDLCCHRSGLKTFSGDLIWYESNYSRKEVIERAQYLEPVYGFRSQFGYSNIMFSAAGEIIPVITGISWEDYIRKEFFKRLGMNSSLVSVSELKPDANLAIPHHTADSIKPLPIKYMKWDNVAPAAGIISNVEDMSKWLIMQMNEGIYNGDTILDELQLWEMHSPQTPDNSSKAWLNYFPTQHFDTYGLGWSLFDYQGVKVVSHGGGADGMISQTMFVPEKDFGIVVLTNSINYLPTALMYYVIDDFFGDPSNNWSNFYLRVYNYGKSMDQKDQQEMIKNRVTGTKPSLKLEDYQGIYSGELYGDVEVKLENGRLLLNFKPSYSLVGDLYHWHYDTFTIKLRNSPTLPKGTVNFILNEEGKPEELKINIPNPDFDFTELILKKR